MSLALQQDILPVLFDMHSADTHSSNFINSPDFLEYAESIHINSRVFYNTHSDNGRSNSVSL